MPKCLIHKREMILLNPTTGDKFVCPQAGCKFTRTAKSGAPSNIRGSRPERIEEVPAPKRVVVKKKLTAPDTNPAKRVQPRKPKCPVHTVIDMKFNAVRGVWQCSQDGCKMIARPSNESDTDQITLGKGQLHVRVFIDPKNVESTLPTVVLMSDNNVALDITEYVQRVMQGGYLETHAKELLRGAKMSPSGSPLDLELSFEGFTVFDGTKV